jgi:DNA-binding protein H-NS
MKLDTLDALNDDDLRAVIGRAEALLKQHDTERKDKALEQARAILESVGLSLKDVAGKPQRRSVQAKSAAYHTGRTYQHPTNNALTWNGKGKRPAWISALEAEGKTPLAL